mgnify:CR=1 FL=1|jgi:hypothetical protein
MQNMTLPKGFEDLALWAMWDHDLMSERSLQRAESTMEEIQSFYDAMLPRMENILEYLVAVPMSADMDLETKSLLNLTKSMAEVAPAVEQFFEPTISFGFDTTRWEHGPE